MKEELEYQIFDKFHKLFKNRLNEKISCLYYGIETGDGWYNLLFDSLSKIINIAPDNFEIVQIKEKFGRLTIYSDNSTEQIDDIISKAEKASQSICEICGAPGKLSKGNWILTLCETCEKRERFSVEIISSQPSFDPLAPVELYIKGQIGKPGKSKISVIRNSETEDQFHNLSDKEFTLAFKNLQIKHFGKVLKSADVNKIRKENKC